MKSKKILSGEMHYFLDSVLNSYSQIFFSTYRPFALLIIIVSFFDYHVGLMGLLAVLTTSVTAFMFNLDKHTIAKGLYGFNSLLVGLGLGVYYGLSWQLFFIVILAGIFTLFISVALQGVIGKYNLPYLSVPFLIALWVFTLATRHFEALNISERGIYTFNDLYLFGGSFLVNLYEWFNNLEIPSVLRVYFISLSAILFQYNILAGMIIALGLLLFSRIAFTLSLLGFFIAFGFYHVIEANITAIDYSYIGFNYILTAIAIGGYFLIPSVRSYLSVVILIPLVAIITISLNIVLITFKLPIYSLPFNIVVLLYLYVLKFRTEYSYNLSEVYYQFNSPEKNLYTFINNKERFRFKFVSPVKLPFFGIWQVSQGHNGEYTHKEDWRHAWDFVIVDDKGEQYRDEGNVVEDYLCYNKPVIAPEDGVIEEVLDDIDDNLIGDVNLNHNWGNTIIIKHAENVYSKLCHLKKGSITVEKGDKVEFGQIIGKCGNSGRSPYPHLHFQIQEYPYVGSETMDYPISSYIKHDNNNPSFLIHSKPTEKNMVSNVDVNFIIDKALHFVSGQMLTFEVQGHHMYTKVIWYVKVNAFNQPYLECDQTGAKAYYESDSNMFYFTHYDGDKSSLLYSFFLGVYKVQKGFYNNMVITDQYPLHIYFPNKILWFHDFIAPFYQMAKSQYKLSYTKIDDVFSPSEIKLEARSENILLKKTFNQVDYDIIMGLSGISSFSIKKSNHTIKLNRIFSNED